MSQLKSKKLLTTTAPVFMSSTNSLLNQLYHIKSQNTMDWNWYRYLWTSQKPGCERCWLFYQVFDLHSHTHTHTHNYPLLTCILGACFQNSVFHRLLSVTMVLNSKQMNSKYFLRIGISNLKHTVFSIHNPRILWNAPSKLSNALSNESNKMQPRIIPCYFYPTNYSV